jgi:hypothetical protein
VGEEVEGGSGVSEVDGVSGCGCGAGEAVEDSGWVSVSRGVGAFSGAGIVE